jgi:hypothetical protein
MILKNDVGLCSARHDLTTYIANGEEIFKEFTENDIMPSINTLDMLPPV